MAGDWIKMEVCTPDKPEVFAIAAKMGWDDSDMAVGKLFRLWRWFDQHTRDGNAVGVTSKLLDRYIGVDGFVTVVASVGWLVVTEDGIRLNNFDRHNGETAKKRATGAKRTAKHRSKTESNGQCNAEDVTKTSPEKRREDSSVPKGTGDKSPLTNEEIIFTYGVPLLTSAGSTDKAARSFLGGLRKEHGDDAVVDKLRQCMREKPLQPLEWLAAALPPAGSGKALQRLKNASAEPAWRTEQRNRTIAAVPGIAERGPIEFFLDVEARNVTTPSLG